MPGKLIVWPMLAWSSVAAMIVGIRIHKPADKTAWYLLTAGVAAFIVADNLYSYRQYVQHAKTLFPSYVDIVYLAMYPLLVLGLMRLVRRRTPGRDRSTVVDAAIITCGLGLISWMLLLMPSFRSDGLSLPARLTAIAYPLGDVALLAIAFHWIAFYVGWGAAALHPSMPTLSIRATSSRNVTVRRLVLVGSAALIPPAALFVQAAVGTVVDGAAIAITSAIVFILVLRRTAGLAREVADMRNEARFRSLVNNASDAILVVDDAGVIRYQTSSAARVLQRLPSDLLDHSLPALLGEAGREQLRGLLSTAGITARAEWQMFGRNGLLRDMEVIFEDLRGDNGVAGFLITMRDMTDCKALAAELREQAWRDALTGLPNRLLFDDRVAQALTRSAGDRADVAVLYIDLDDFKTVNDSLGQPVGDELLKRIASRLLSVVKSRDTIARFGGDEFGVLVSGGVMVAEAVAQQVLEALREPLRVGDNAFTVRASIGIAVGRASTHSSTQLLRDADLAMYMAKRNGKARFERFAPSLHEESVRRLQVASELEGAIANDQLVLHYQPIVAVATGHMVGAEALVRWNHPSRGLLAPIEFVPIAESTGLVVPLGRWVLDTACRQAGEWRQAGILDDDFYLSVNLSARHFQDHGVVDDVVHALDASHLPARALLIEITESAMVDNLDPGGVLVRELKALGTRLAIDDFGTGYSSLARLTTFPIDVVKIDKSFVDRLTGDAGAGAGAMVRAVIALTHALGMTTVAEGVEHWDQAEALSQLGCTVAQGYLFDRPMACDDLAEVLRSRTLSLCAH